MLVARTISAAFSTVPIAVTTAPVAPTPAMLLAFAFRPRALTLGLAFGRKLMELGSLAARHGRLRRTRLLSLLLLALGLLSSLLISPISFRARSTIGTSILALALAIALLGLAVAAAATLFEASVLLPVAAAAFATLLIISPSAVAPLVAVATLLLVAAVIALLCLGLRLDGCRRRSGGGARCEEAAEDAGQETLCRCGGRLDGRLWCLWCLRRRLSRTRLAYA